MCAYRIRPAAGLFSSILFFLAAPAEAHHPGGGGNTGSGGPINTISADTLSEGLMAASIRYEFIRLGQLSDTDLLAAAAKGTHAHSLRSIDAVSISAAYGVTNDFTVAVRAGGVRREQSPPKADRQTLLPWVFGLRGVSLENSDQHE